MNLIGKDHRFFLQQLYYYYSFLHEMSERRACEEILSRRVSFISCAMFCRCLSLSLCLPLCVSVFMRCVTLRVLIANRMVTDSSCRGGIVNIRDVCSCALSKAPQSSKALWRFRVSTSNSLNGHSWPPTNTQIREIYRTYAQQDIQVYEDDHFEPPKRQYPNPKALSLLRVSI